MCGGARDARRVLSSDLILGNRLGGTGKVARHQIAIHDKLQRDRRRTRPLFDAGPGRDDRHRLRHELLARDCQAIRRYLDAQLIETYLVH